MRECYEDTARRAESQTLSYEQYLLEVIYARMRAAAEKSGAAVAEGLGAAAGEVAAEFRSEAIAQRKRHGNCGRCWTADFWDRKENILVFGNPGSGKSHLLTALAQELVVGRERKMHFTKCALLMQDLLAAKRDLRLSREIKRLGRYDGLIIDDLGYLQQSRDDMEVVFTLLAERYERGSVLMTSNLAFSKWEGIFKDAMMTAAAIDRLVHHSVIIELNIPSYRVEEAKKKQQAEARWKRQRSELPARPNPTRRELWKCRGCGKRGKPKAGFPLFPRAPWKSRQSGEIPTFPQLRRRRRMEKWKTKSRFPTFPPPLFLSLKKRTEQRRAGFARAARRFAPAEEVRSNCR